MVALAIAPDTEAERLEALHEYRILDSAKDPAFQRIAEMACVSLSAASCAISFVDAERSWKKASIGWVIQDSPREVSLSNYIMEKGETFVVSDALAHPEVSELLPVRQDVGRFYAGAPLVSPTGYLIGAIVVADPQPREDSPEIHEKLNLLADLAMDQLNLHRLRQEYDREARARRVHELQLMDQKVALERNDRLFSQLSDLASIGAWELDLSEGNLTWSPEVFRIHELEGGKTPSLEKAIEFYDDEYRDTVRNAMMEALQSGEAFEHVLPITSAAGNRKWVKAIGEVQQIGDKPISIFGTFQDVTEQRKTEENLRQAQKMEAVGQLTGGIAHDFNNLLTVIMGNLQMHLGTGRFDDKMEAQLQSAYDAALKGAELTKRLLAFSRKQVLESKTVVVNAIIDGMSDMIRRSVGESIELDLQMNRRLWPISIDPGQMETAILNLAINARDAMPEGGSLKISTHNIFVGENTEIDIGKFNKGPCVLISVTDSGTGISEELYEQVFEPFFTTKPEGQGSGLGLSMVFGFVKQSGGNIEIESTLGEGTTFKIFLPATIV
ncbi:MAG: ATP-binding protein [Hyphomicrobiales bacterium]